MKLLLKILLGLVVFVVVVVTAGILYISYSYPKVAAAPKIKVDINPETVARGEYLAKHVAVCIDCHSTRDWSYYAGPLKEGTEGMGGDLFDESAGLPGSLYAKNITPAALSTWTDGEIYRTITTGVNKYGEPLFPFMPYQSYASMDPEDVKAIIAYIRTLKPIVNDVPKRSLNFPMNLIVRTIPHDATPSKRPSESDTLAYGKYMLKIGGCGDCHTPADKGTPLPGMFLAGGFEFPLPNIGLIRSANITPDNETGIGKWTEDDFVKFFKNYDNPDLKHLRVDPGQPNTVMPKFMYAGMKVEDLRAIYKYLRSVQPVHHVVEKFTPFKKTS